MTFSEKLIELRKGAGETQDSLGESLGVSGKTVSKWEAAATEPDLSMIAALADHYQVSVDELLGRTKPMNLSQMIRAEVQKTERTERYSLLFQVTRDLIGSLWPEGCTTSPLKDCVPTVTVPIDKQFRSNYENSDCGMFTYHTDNVRLGLQVFRSPSDFAWILSDKEKLADLFGLFGDPDMFPLLYAINRADFSEEFTAAYLAEKSGVAVEKVQQLLDSLLPLGGIDNQLRKGTLETLDGEVTIYTYYGAGLLMGILSLMKILLDGWGGSNCLSYNGICKLIGEQGYEKV